MEKREFNTGDRIPEEYVFSAIKEFNESKEKSYEDYFYLRALRTSWLLQNPDANHIICLEVPHQGEKNKPYTCFTDYTEIPEGTKITLEYPSGSKAEIDVTGETYLTKGKKKILYDGRYCAVSGFVFAVVDGKYSVLANLRGPGCPDFRDQWNCPCGYLERDEDSIGGILREIREECGLYLEREDLKPVYVETRPPECNGGNVTIRHLGFLRKQRQIKYDPHLSEMGGEKDETRDVRWIPVDEISKYSWAFNHLEVIKKYLPSKLKQRILEFIWR